MRSRYQKLQVERAIARTALGLFFLVLLLAPAADARREHRGRHLRQRLGLRQNSSVCNTEITGCSVCFQETPKTADGAEFPGESQAHTLEPIVRCTRCRPKYAFNEDWGNCDCARGHGTAFANGTLIQVDSFVEPKLPTDVSDSRPFPDDNSKSEVTTKPAGGTTTMTFSEAASAPSKRVAGLAAPTTQKRDTQKKLLRRFESNMRSLGYEVHRTDQGTFITASPKAANVASSDGKPVAVETMMEQALICAACKENSVSIGGLIGGSFCMPCPAGMKPDTAKTTCVPV